MWRRTIEELIKDKLSNIFDSINLKKNKGGVLEGGYYTITSKNGSIYIHNDLFVQLVFQEGSSWGEKLFESIFNEKNYRSEIVENPEILKESLFIDIQKDGGLYENGIIIELPESKSENKNKKSKKNIPLPVVIRILQKEIPISDIDKIGETTEILISEKESKDVDIMVNGEVIGKGILFKESNTYKVKITDLYL
ncbi:FliM/FliN family flagellar motor switch protein [Persephonella sp.]